MLTAFAVRLDVAVEHGPRDAKLPADLRGVDIGLFHQRLHLQQVLLGEDPWPVPVEQLDSTVWGILLISGILAGLFSAFYTAGAVATVFAFGKAAI